MQLIIKSRIYKERNFLQICIVISKLHIHLFVFCSRTITRIIILAYIHIAT